MPHGAWYVYLSQAISSSALRALVYLVDQLLPTKVLYQPDSIAGIVRIVVVIPSPEALGARGSLDECAIRAGVLIRHQATSISLVCHLLEQSPSHLAAKKPPPALGEHGRIEARLHEVHVQEPAIEQMVVRFLAE